MQSTAHTIGWGLFCACSWTWCIGLYLPWLLIERFGWPGFIVFAVPNVLGSAGFGYVVAQPSRSAAMVERHRGAMVLFSIVAIAFHLFFLSFLFGWIIPNEGEPFTRALAIPLCVFASSLILSFLRDRAWLLLAAITWIFSVFAFSTIGFGGWKTIIDPSRLHNAELIRLAPVIAIGFLACPYLDLTFHRALRESPSRHAFGVFGVTFLVMIVFTCFLWSDARGVLAPIAIGHLVAQSAFTMGAHVREVHVACAARCRSEMWLALFLPTLGLAILPLARQFSSLEAISLGNDMYVRFLMFYGLAFPAYIILFMGPWRPIGLNRRAVIGWIGLIVLLAPLFELGFLHEREWLMIVPPGLIVAWAIARRERVVAA